MWNRRDGSAVRRRPSTGRTAGACAVAALLLVLSGCSGQEGASSTRATVTVTGSPKAAATSGAAASTGAATSATSGSPSPAVSSTAASSDAAGGPLAQASAICARRGEELAKLAGPSSSGDMAALASVASRRAAVERRADAELRALAAPAQFAPAWREVIALGEASLHRTEALARAASGHDAGQVRSLSLSADPSSLRGLVAARQSHLTKCYQRAAWPALGTAAVVQAEVLKQFSRGGAGARTAPAP